MRNRKWNTFGLRVFILNILLYWVFVAMLTAVVLVVPLPQGEKCNGNSYKPIRDSDII